jgi:hypothetical protein
VRPRRYCDLVLRPLTSTLGGPLSELSDDPDGNKAPMSRGTALLLAFLCLIGAAQSCVSALAWYSRRNPPFALLLGLFGAFQALCFLAFLLVGLFGGRKPRQRRLAAPRDRHVNELRRDSVATTTHRLALKTDRAPSWVMIPIGVALFVGGMAGLLHSDMSGFDSVAYAATAYCGFVIVRYQFRVTD